MRSLVVLACLCSVASAERLRVKSNVKSFLEDFTTLAPRISGIPVAHTYRKNWVGKVKIHLDAFHGIFPEEFEIDLDIDAPGSIVGAKVIEVDFHDTAALDGIKTITIDATISLAHVPSEDCVAIRARILPGNLASNHLHMCLTSLPRKIEPRLWAKTVPTPDGRARANVLHVRIEPGTTLSALRKIETAMQGKFSLEGHVGAMAILMLHMHTPARDERELSARVATLDKFPEVISVDLDFVH